MKIRIVASPITRAELLEIAHEGFGDMVKAAVDVERSVMAIGGEFHADEEAMLLEQGSRQEDVWGINLYPEQHDDAWVEFDSMINIQPSQKNRSRSIENPDIRSNILAVVAKLTLD